MIGLLPIAERLASAVLGAGRAKAAPRERRRQIVAAALPLLAEAVEIGLDQATIAVDTRKRELRALKEAS